MVIDHTDPFAPSPKPDRALIRLVVRAHRFHDLLVSIKGGKFGDLCEEGEVRLLQPNSFGSPISPPTSPPFLRRASRLTAHT